MGRTVSAIVHVDRRAVFCVGNVDELLVTSHERQGGAYPTLGPPRHFLQY